MGKKRLRETFRMQSFHFRFFWTCVVLVLAWNGAYAQLEKRVTISVKDVRIRTLLTDLEKKANVAFVYDEKLISETQTISMSFKDAPLKQVLDDLCDKISLRYELQKNLILLLPLTKKPTTAPEQIKIRGMVTDRNKNPIPGVTVLLKGTGMGTVTLPDGRYVFSLPKSNNITLVFSFVGMETQEIKYKGNDTINVVMKEDVKQMNEVVVTGYQRVNKRSMAGSTSYVKAEDLVLNGSQTLEQALQGKIPGMIVMNKSGLTGTRQRVRVRGTSTLLGSAEPIWVVDGVIQTDPLPFETNDLSNIDPTNMDMMRDFIGGAISWLNPNDIADITVLKDAASTAIYGVKAANGVIVITTKKGEKGRLVVNYNGNFSITPRLNYNRMELMNSQQRVDVSREAYERGLVLGGNQEIGYLNYALQYKRGEISLEKFSEMAKILETRNTDWFDILFRNAFSHNHSISISGGGDKSTYHASIGVNQQNNTAKGNDQINYTANMSMSATLWNNVTLDMNVAGSVANTNAFLGSDPYTYASSTNRTIPCFNEDGSLYYYKHNNGYLYNIINELNESKNKNTVSALKANVNFRWQITEDLSFNTLLSYQYSHTRSESWYTEQSNYMAKLRTYNYEEFPEGSDEYKRSYLPYGGEFNENETATSNWSWRNQLEYSRVFHGLHYLTIMLGQEANSTKTNGFKSTRYGYMHDQGRLFVRLPDEVKNQVNMYATDYIPSITDTENNYLSYFATFSYMYDNRYSVNLSVRGDASNRFGQDRDARFQPVWAVGLRWNVGSEHWLEGQKILSDMSLRATYGYQGNVAENVSPELTASFESLAEGGYGLRVTKLPAPKLKWEKVNSINLGVDISLFDHKVRASFEWYTKKTTDMITSQRVAYEHGVLSMPVNGGKMKNSGWDASVNFVPYRDNDWVVSLGFNFSKIKNEVNSTIEPTGSWQEASSGNLNKDGYPVTSFWAFDFTGLNPETGGPEFDLTGMEKTEAVSDATVYMKYAGKMDPDFTTGVTFSIRWKSLTLNSGLNLSIGGKTFLAPMSTNYTSIPSEYENMSTEWLGRWRKPGDEARTNIPSLPDIATSAAPIRLKSDVVPDGEIVSGTYRPYEMYAYSDARVVDAWYLRCNNIQLSWNVPEKSTPKFLQFLSFNCSVSNPFQLRSKDFKGRDPEVALGNQPLSSSWSLGISMGF